MTPQTSPEPTAPAMPRTEQPRTELWLVRHGATEWSENGRHTGKTDLPLLPQGEADAERLRARLAGTDFGLVLSSPRQRARETARLAGFADPEIDPDLAEWDYGPGEGLTTPQIQELVPNWRVWTHGAPVIEGQPAGETKAEAAARLARVVERVRASGVERVLAFGHGHALRVLATVWCDFPVEAGWHFPLSTATISVLGYEKVTPALVRWNCAA